MDVSTITMDPDVAEERLAEYEEACRRSKDAELAAIRDGYEALAEGTPLLNLQQVIRESPRDEKHRPMLAIARADRRQVGFTWSHGAEEAHFCANASLSMYQLDRDSTLGVHVNMGEAGPGVETTWGRGASHGYALVPLTPPNVLPQRSHLRRYFVLWEVEEWSDSEIGVQPDRDPLLLRHLGGDLYVVHGAWDLTDLERAVMAGRALR